MSKLGCVKKNNIIPFYPLRPKPKKVTPVKSQEDLAMLIIVKDSLVLARRKVINGDNGFGYDLDKTIDLLITHVQRRCKEGK